MLPVKFKEMTGILAENQPEYLPLPVWQDKTQTVSLWSFTWRERFKLLLTGHLWLRQLNFNQDLQPQAPSVDYPFVKPRNSRLVQ